MEIPESDLSEDTDEEVINQLYDRIIDDHRVILESENGEYNYDFFSNKLGNVRILQIVLSGNELSSDEKKNILELKDNDDTNLLLHILNVIEEYSQIMPQNISEYHTMFMIILDIYPEAFIMKNSNDESPFFHLLKHRLFDDTTINILIRYNELGKIYEILSLRDQEGDTPLHQLILDRRNEFIKFILNTFHPENVARDFLYIKNNDEETLLQLCCKTRLNVEIANLLLDKGVLITECSENENTPLHYLLLSHYNYINLDFVERLLNTPLHPRLKSSQPDARNILHVKDIDGYTAVVENLHVSERVELLSLFLNYDLDINEQDPENGDNLLHRCIKFGHFDSFKLLMAQPTLKIDLFFNDSEIGIVSPFKYCIKSLIEYNDTDSESSDEEYNITNLKMDIQMYALLLRKGLPPDLDTFSGTQKQYHEKIFEMVRATVLQAQISKKIMLYAIKSSSDNIFPLIHMVKNLKQLGDAILLAKVLKIDYEMKNIEEIKKQIIEKLMRVLGKKLDYGNPNEPPSVISIRDLFTKIGQISEYSSENLENPEIFLYRFNKLFTNLDKCINRHFTEEQELYISLLNTGIELQHEDIVYKIHEETKKRIKQKRERERDPWRRSRDMYKRSMPMADSKSGGSKKSKKRTRKKLKKSHKKLKKTNKRSKRISKRNNKKKL